MTEAYDLVIRGGAIVDGTGATPYQADLAVNGDRIVAIGDIPGSGVAEIDATGRIVTPGFVDVHTHYDGQITWENRLAPSSDHGVTSVIMGNCGVGFAPCRPGDQELMVRLMEGVEDIPGVVMTEGVPWNWETFPDYLDALDKRHADVDFAAQIPHSPLRVYVMGERGLDESPTAHDLTEMRRLTTEAIKAGALGVSTSHSIAHRFRDGRLAPSVTTGEEDVLALASGLRDAGTGVFQILPTYEVHPAEQFELIRSIAQTAQRPVSFTFAQSPMYPDGWRRTLADMERATRDGLEIRGQVMPRPIGTLFGLELSLHPFAYSPSYRAIADLPLAEKVAAFRDPGMRQRLLSETPEDPQEMFKMIISEKEMLFVLGDPPNYNPTPEESIGALARAQGRDVNEVIYDALLLREGREILYRPFGNTIGESRFESAGANLLKHDNTVIGLGDGGAHYGMICDAAFTTYLLTYWLNKATPGLRLGLAQAIKLLTSEPANAVGLRDRGILKPGFKADINVIDLDRLHLHAPHVTYDLPAGGRRLSQKADGYDATIVSGQITYRGGKPTGALPGRLQRYARPDPEVARAA